MGGGREKEVGWSVRLELIPGSLHQSLRLMIRRLMLMLLFFFMILLLLMLMLMQMETRSGRVIS